MKEQIYQLIRNYNRMNAITKEQWRLLPMSDEYEALSLEWRTLRDNSLAMFQSKDGIYLVHAILELVDMAKLESENPT